jgi:hypothetical protein
VVTKEIKNFIIGLKAISDYMERSPMTVLRLIHHEGFPAKKISGSWYSSREAINFWINDRVSSKKTY